MNFTLLPSSRGLTHSSSGIFAAPHSVCYISVHNGTDTKSSARLASFEALTCELNRGEKWPEHIESSDCLLCQAFCSTSPAQLNAARASRARAFSRINNLCAKATRITRLGFPLAA